MVRVITAPPGTGGWLASSATFSDDMAYRYVLERVLKPGGGRCVFIGLNPSTADEMKNDPTVTRCINYARAWGYCEFVMLNAYGLRSTDPAGLKACNDPIGAENDKYIIDAVKQASLVVAAWGTHARLLGRHEALLGMLPALHCLGMTKEGYPRHPLYLRKDLNPVVYSAKTRDE